MKTALLVLIRPASRGEAPSPAPLQPPLFIAIGNGFLVYCGLIVAGSASFLSTVAETAAPAALRIALAAAAGFGLLAGVLALLVMAWTHNHARRWERGAPHTRIDAARTASVAWASAALGASLMAALAFGAALVLFMVSPPASPAAVPTAITINLRGG